MSLFAARRERVLSLAPGYDSVVVLDPRNLFYLTDFWGGGIGIVGEDATTIVTSVMETQRATETGRDAQVVTAKGQGGMHQAARNLIGEGKKVMTDRYDPNFPGVVNDGAFLAARRKKDSEEILRITQATKKVEKTYGLIESVLRPGKSEIEVAAEVIKLAVTEGLSPLAAEGSLSPIIIGSGPNAALPHAELSERKIARGDMVVADIFFRYRGYCTDCTRTYAVGNVPKEWSDAYDSVLEAQEKGIETIKAEAAGKEVHGIVSSVLAKKGLEKFFIHGTGHGVGIDIHERPSIGSSSNDILTEGDVVTVEPGIYIPGRYGIRIEDTLVVGEKTKNLYEYTKELVTL